MKRYAFLILSLLLVVTVLFAACGEQQETSVSSVASVESSSEESDETSEESETTSDSGTDSSIQVLYSSYSEKPYFAMVGTCEEGAVVTAECGGETVSSESYMGWFSLRLRCEGASVDVTLTQTVDGEQIGEPYTVTAKPKTPGADMWPVITGENFQFFFQKMLPDYSGTNIPSRSVYTSLTNRVKNRLTQLRQYHSDAEIIYLIVPASMSVYPELVPEDYGEQAEETRLDLAIDAIRAGGGVAIDLKALFEEHKEDEMPLYYKLDSHWSDYGAFVAYDALFDHISQRFPEAAPRSVDAFDWNADYYESGDITYYLAMSQNKVLEYAYYRTFDVEVPSAITATPRYRSDTMLCYSDAMTYEKTIKTDRDTLPSCIVFRDSYSTQIYDILAERMNTTHYLGMWSYTWSESMIKSEQPDYIIYIVAEWNLDAILYN